MRNPRSRPEAVNGYEFSNREDQRPSAVRPALAGLNDAPANAVSISIDSGASHAASLGEDHNRSMINDERAGEQQRSMGNALRCFLDFDGGRSQFARSGLAPSARRRAPRMLFANSCFCRCDRTSLSARACSRSPRPFQQPAFVTQDGYTCVIYRETQLDREPTPSRSSKSVSRSCLSSRTGVTKENLPRGI